MDAVGDGMILILAGFLIEDSILFAPLSLLGVDPSFITQQPLMAKLASTAFILVSVLAIMYWTRNWPEVFDGGDHLLYNQHGKEQELPFSEIREITYNRFTHKITIHPRWPGPLGDELSFYPNAGSNLFFKPAIVKELNERIGAATAYAIPKTPLA